MNWRRGLKWLNFTLIIPLLVITLFFYVLLYTQLGLNLSVWTVKKFIPELTIDQSTGRLLGKSQLKGVHWQQDKLNSIGFSQLDIDVQLSCLFSAKVCINQLHADSLVINMVSPKTTTKETAAMQPIFLPFPITLNDIAITNANIVLDGHQLNWRQLSAKAQAWGSKLQLDDVFWQDVHFSPANLDEKTSSTLATKTEPFSYQAPVLENINLPLAIYISQFTLEDFTLDTATPQQLPLLQFAVQAQQQQIHITQLHLQHQQLSLDASLKLSMNNNYPVTAQMDILLLEQPLAQQKIAIEIEGDLANLMINVKATNNLQAQLDANLALLTDNLPITAKLTAANPNVFALDEKTALSIKASALTIKGDLQQLQLTAKTDYKLPDLPAGNMELKGSITPINAKIDKLLISALAGKAEITATVDWQHDLQWHSYMLLKNINPGILLQDYPGRIDGHLTQQGTFNADGSWLVNISKLDFNGEIRQLPFILRGDLQAQTMSSANIKAAVPEQPLNNISFKSNRLSLIHGDNSLNFSGSLAEHWQVKADVNIPDLADSVADATGKVKGKISVSGTRMKPSIVSVIEATDMRFHQFSLGQLQLESEVQLAEQISGNITLLAEQGHYQHYTLEHLALNIQGDEYIHTATLELQSNVAQAEVAVSGQLNRAKNWLGQLSQARLSSVQGQWQLQQAVDLQYEFAQQQAKIAQHCWQQQQTTLCLEQQAIISTEQGQLSLSLQDFSLSTLNAILPATIETEGEIQASAIASWQQNAVPKVAITVQGTNGNAKLNDGHVVNLPWQNLKLQLDSSEQLTAHFAIDFSETSNIRAQAIIADLSLAERTLDGQLNINAFRLDFLQPLLDSNSTVKAEVNSKLQFSGLLSAPDLSGSLSVDNIQIIGKQAPTTIENGQINLAFIGETAAITGNLNTPDGSITLTGDANWQDLNDWQAKMQLSGDALSLQVPNVALKVIPDLKVEITPQLTLITGVVEVPSASISIDDLPQSAITISNDTILLDEQGIAMEPAKATIPIHTDIKVILNKDVKLQAFGLVTKLSGELTVKQQDKGPQLYGEVALIDGTFRSYGQDLLIRRGKLKFNGPPDQPYLDIEAIRNPESTEDDVVAGIKVVGPADEPNVSIFSEPSKPQANALSYLIAGRDIGSDSGTTSDALTTSLIGMSIASSSKLVGNIGAAFGIDDLSLDTAGAGTNSQVTVSGHLSPDLELKYGYGIFNALGEFTLRYRIMRRLYLQSVSGLNNTVDLLYKFEFD